MKFLCMLPERDGRILASRTLDRPNAIEALRDAASASGYTGTWTAYTPVVTKVVTIKDERIRSVSFSDPE